MTHRVSEPKHPFEGTPQYEQIYGPNRGPRIGRKGNGLGSVWGSTGAIDDNHESDVEMLGRRPRMSNSHPVDKHADLEVERRDHRWIDAILSALPGLTSKQRFVIEMRFGLRGEAEFTLEDIAFLMGVTHQAVRAIERRAIKRLQFLTSGGMD